MITYDAHELVDAWLRAHRKGNLTDHLVAAGFARLLSPTAADLYDTHPIPESEARRG